MELEEQAADPLAGGLMHGYQCGMVWGIALAAGAQAYRLYGAGPQAEVEAMAVTQEMVDVFRNMNKHINCRDITGIDLTSPNWGMVLRFLVKTAPRGTCFGMAARTAKAAYRRIGAAFSGKPGKPLENPVSCAALLARKMGASDLHTVMASGFAGGVGLSGGGCGALGAAIWISGMSTLKEGTLKEGTLKEGTLKEGTLKEGALKIGLKDPKTTKLIEQFCRQTNQEFECSKITGRQFSSLEDHAGYIRQGGCEELIQVLLNG